jgi:hypothetical protein
MQETTYIDLLNRRITSCQYYFLMEYSILMTVSTIALWANLSQYNKKDSQESMIHENSFLLQSSLHITHNKVQT